MDRMLKAARTSGSLNLSNRSLRDVPDEVYQNFDTAGYGDKWWEAVDLQKLILAHNNIEVLKEDLKNLPLLTVLNVSHNKLIQLPAAIGELPSLKSLDVSFNSIANIPVEIGSASSLVKIDCSNNQLTGLPNSLGQCSELSELKASNNCITSLPEDLVHCTKLVKVEIEGNKLTELSDPLIASWSKLTELNASKNLLNGVPESIGSLSRLIRLDLHQNKIGLMKSLRKLVLIGNPMRTIRSTLVSGPTPALLKYLRSRLPSAQEAEAMTPSKDDMVAMAARMSLSSKELSLGGMDLTAVPPEVCASNELTKVDLSRNSIEELPLALSSCSSLEVLILSRNKIKDWPVEVLKSLPNLICLKLDNNPLRQIPLNGFEAVSGLQILDLSFCVGSLSGNPVFASLPHLQELYLRRVQLREVPSDILWLQKLQILDLGQNSLAFIPEELDSVGPVRSGCLNFAQVRWGQSA